MKKCKVNRKEKNMKIASLGILASILVAGTSYASPILPDLLPPIVPPGENLIGFLSNQTEGHYRVTENIGWFAPTPQEKALDEPPEYRLYDLSTASNTNNPIGGPYAGSDNVAFSLFYNPKNTVTNSTFEIVQDVTSNGYPYDGKNSAVFFGYPGTNNPNPFKYNPINGALDFVPSNDYAYTFLPLEYSGGNQIYGYFRYYQSGAFGNPSLYDVNGFGSLTIHKIDVPEPSSLALLLLPLGLMAGLTLRKKNMA